jgi:hypothetical protein
MQLKSSTTGVTKITDIKIQKSCSHILIVKYGAASIIYEKITLQLNTPQGSQRVLPLSKIRRHAVISQFSNGHQLIQVDADDVVKSAFLIGLSDYGAINLGDNTLLQLDLTDLVALSTYEVYALESPVVANSYNEYNTETIVGAEPQAKVFSPSAGCKGIALSNNGSLSSVRLSYNGGNEITLLPEELDAIMRSSNDISFAPDTLIEGDTVNQTLSGAGTELWWIDAASVTKFEVTTTGTGELTVIQIVRKSY